MATQPLTTDQRQWFDLIQSSDAGLMSCRFDGEDTAVIITAEPDGDGMVTVRPWAVLLTDAMAARLADDEDQPPGPLS